MDITHDNVCSSMLSCFYLHLLSTGRPISSYMYLYPHCAISTDSYTSISEFYNIITFSVLMNAVILLLNCLVLIFYLYIGFLSLMYFSCTVTYFTLY